MHTHIYTDESGYPGTSIQSIAACIVPPSIVHLFTHLEKIITYYQLDELKWSRVRSSKAHFAAAREIIDILALACQEGLDLVILIYEKDTYTLAEAYHQLLYKHLDSKQSYILSPDTNTSLKRNKPSQKVPLPIYIHQLDIQISEKQVWIQVADILAGAARDRWTYKDLYQEQSDLTRQQQNKYLCIQQLQTLPIKTYTMMT